LADGTLTLLVKVNLSLAWIFHSLTFDSEYHQQKYEVYNSHPKGLLDGFYQGGVEFIFGFWDALYGFFVKPIAKASTEGVIGTIINILRGIIGLPTKSLGGFF